MTASPHPFKRPVHAGSVRLAWTVLAFGLGAAPAVAWTDSLSGCDAMSLELTEAFLRDEQYTRVETLSQLTRAQAMNAAWTLMAPYLDIAGLKADRGGEDIETILDLQERAVPGLFRKVDTDRTRFRLYARDADVMTVTETRTGNRDIRRTCVLALGPDARDVVSASALDTEDHPDAPARGLYRTVTILLEE